MKTKILIILIVVVGLGTGGFFVYKNIIAPEAKKEIETSGIEEKIEVYPGAVEVDVSPNLAKEIRGDLSPDVEIKVYSSKESVEKIKNWYRSHLSDKGWEKIWDGIKEEGEFGFMLWKKGKTGFSVGLNLAPNVKGGTSILLVKDEFEAWGEILETLKKEEAKKLIKEALLKIEKIKSEKDLQKLQLLISEAVEYGKKATEFDPKNPEILFQMGNIYFEIREITSGAEEWAMHYYKKALELDPGNPLYQEKLREIQS
ncbi:hypothetical protein L6250_01495 [Candidatus Parcubacteria bacterium]|nr:hypothetical protein [Candidatus Omnitrophota bacterium]MCG2688289.1 hypothetical protein [Candidatus Parcubacteria bacterium]